jgi:hypothetical protein
VATVRARINPNGAATGDRVEFVTEAAYLQNGFAGATKVPATGQNVVGAGTNPITVVRTLSLQPGTSYRFRFVAINGDGTTEGPVRWVTADSLGAVFSLPDGRGWEMVSPADKNGGEIQGVGGNYGGGVLQAPPGGGQVTYSSSASFANAQGAPGASQYVSVRGSSGWSTENVSLPTESGAYGDEPDGVPYRVFSSDLSSALVLDGRRCPAVGPCDRSYSARTTATGVVSSLPYQEPDLNLAGSSPNLAHVALSTCAALTPDATEVPSGGGCDPEKPNLYLRSVAALRLINLLPGDPTGTPGASLAAQSRAISADGTRVYWTDGAKLFLRNGGSTLQVDGGVSGGGAFQTASVEGDVAFFTKAGHLYRYLVSTQAATDLTPGGGVTGVLGASDEGGAVYYATASSLVLWRSGSTIPVASGAFGGNYPPTTGSARVSSDGGHLAFVSPSTLAEYDNVNGATGISEPEVYLYTAPGPGPATLVCASCNPSGERPTGPAGLPGASKNGTGKYAPNAYKPRVLSADSRRLFFNTVDALVSQDTNKVRDVYQWEADGSGSCAKPSGCVSLLSSGRSELGSTFVDASSDGDDAFFLTDGSLVPDDPGAVDLYDARVGGGFPLPPGVIPCVGDDCQVLPPEPEDPTPGTLRPGSGNPPAVFPVKCGKNKVKKKGKCVPKKKKRGHGKRGGRR